MRLHLRNSVLTAQKVLKKVNPYTPSIPQHLTVTVRRLAFDFVLLLKVDAQAWRHMWVKKEKE